MKVRELVNLTPHEVVVYRGELPYMRLPSQAMKYDLPRVSLEVATEEELGVCAPGEETAAFQVPPAGRPFS